MSSTILFWSALLLLVYTYFLYPIVLFIVAKLFPSRNSDKTTEEQAPFVSVIIAARNEEKNISARLSNLCHQEYPKEKYEIIVISDGSTDGTEQEVKRFQEEYFQKSPTISFSSLDKQSGKPTAINTAVGLASGDILVFADCRQRFSKTAIAELVASFRQPQVGCVSGELLFTKDKEDSEIGEEMGLYWKYEKAIRKLESCTGSVIGATGAIYAVRKELFVPMPKETILDDVYIPLQILLNDYSVIFNPRAKAFDQVSKTVSAEWKRKVRTLAGNWQLFSIAPASFNPQHFSLFWRLLSHKISRLMVPFLLVGIFTICLIGKGTFFNIMLLIQLGFYGCAIVAHIRPEFQKSKLMRLIYFFCVLNLAALFGFLYWASGKTGLVWQSTVSSVDKSDSRR